MKHAVDVVLEVALLLSTVAGQDELLSNGHFTAPLSQVAARASRGHYSLLSATSGDMVPFPSAEMTGALQVATDPTDGIRTTTHVQLRSAFGVHGAGWYRVRFFATAADTYNGLDAPIALEVVDGDGQLLWPARTVRLRPFRDEWLYYETWVECNPLPVLDGYTNAMRSALQIIVSPGSEFTSGTLQLTGASITFIPVDQRSGLTKLDLCACTDPAGRSPQGYCGSADSPSCQPLLSCPIPIDSHGNCQAAHVSYGGTSPESAYDGVATPSSSGWHIAAATADTILLDIEIPEAAAAAAPVPICAARLTFDGQYPQQWRLRASQTPHTALTTWVEAGVTTGGEGAAWRAAVTAGRMWTTSGNGQLDVALGCQTAGRIQLEMEDANGDGLFIRLLELELLTAPPTLLDCYSKCRNGGKCTESGECSCPFHSGCTHRACGFDGDLCDIPTCVSTIECNHQGICGGPNTCLCSPGWHGLAGLEQCLGTECGDGQLTPDEGCDDGNLNDGDGCDSNCMLEALPVGHSRVISDEWMSRWLPRADIHASVVSEETIGITLAVRPEQIRRINLGVVVDGVDGVEFEHAEYEVHCDRECYNGGTCVTGFENDFAPACSCLEGFHDDERCGSNSCSIQCDHGGYCTSDGVCENCASGWTGVTCGTVSSVAGEVVVYTAGLMMGLLAATGLLVLYRQSFPPLRARGITSVIAKCCGGVIWLATAVVSLRGEQFNYDSAVNTLRAPMIIGGFGLWFSSNLMYLRSMAEIHLFHRVPLSFLPMLFICISPWVLAALVQSYTAALAIGVVYFAYTAQLLSTLWTIRNDLTDVVHHSLGCLLGIAVVVFSTWLMERADKTRNDPWASNADVAAAFSSELALGNAAATVVIILVHYVSSTGHLVYQALFKFNDPAILEMYHDEFQASHEDSSSAASAIDKMQARRVQIENFDRKVHAHAKTIPAPPSLLKGRVATNKFQTGGKSNSTVQPHGTHEVGNEDTGRMTYHREQFGRRRKLKSETLQALGRPPVATQSIGAPTTITSEVDGDQEVPEEYFGRFLENETDEDVIGAMSIAVAQHELPGAMGVATDNRADVESSSKYAVYDESKADVHNQSTASSREHAHQHSGQPHHAESPTQCHSGNQNKERDRRQLPPLLSAHHGSHDHHSSGNVRHDNVKHSHHAHHGHHEHQKHEKP